MSYFQDQKTNRTGYCTLQKLKSTPAEIKFKKRAIQEQVQASSSASKKININVDALVLSDIEPISDNETEENDLDYNEKAIGYKQNRKQLRTLAETCDR